MGRRMQKVGPTQDSAGNLEGKSLCKKKVVAASTSSSSSNEETSEEHKRYSCTSCPRKFSSQYALAGHRNIHRSEWEFLLQDEGKMQHRPKLPCKPELSQFPNTTNALKQESPLPCALPYPLVNPTNNLKGSLPRYPFGNHRNTLEGQSPTWPMANPTNSLGWPAACAPRCPLNNPGDTVKGPSPLANPTNAFNWPSIPAPRYILANPADTLIGSSLGAPCYTFVRPTKTLIKPLVADLTQPLDNRANPHPKSALGVRQSSMIHKPSQFRQPDLRSTLSGEKQLMKGNIRRFDSNNNNFYLKFFSTTEGASSSSREGGASSEVRDFFSTFFQSRGGKVIKEHDFFACSPAKERHNCGIEHSVKGLATQQDSNGENESPLDIDLDLKL